MVNFVYNSIYSSSSVMNEFMKMGGIIVKEQTFTITDDTGIHARPATLLVNKAGQYESHVEMHYNGKAVNLKSIMGVMSLGVPKGAEIKVTVEGSDEDQAIEGISSAIREQLGE